MKNRIILMSNTDYLPTLEAARQFGKLGIKVVTVDYKKYRIANWSKYVTYYKSPNIRDTENFLEWLKTKAQEGVFTTILPTSDLMIWYMSSRRKELSKYFDTYIPSKKSVEACLFKDLVYKYCRKHGVGTPTTYFPASLEEVKELAKKIEYPVIIKHRTSIGMQSTKKGEVVFSEGELIKKYKKDAIVYDKGAILNASPYVEWPMVQEYIPDAVDNLYTTQGISANKGKSVALVCGKRIRGEPPKLGIGICSEVIDKPELASEVKKFLRAVKYDGPFGMEVLYDNRDKRYKIIDVNPRVTGLTGLAIGNRLNIPIIWLAILNGKQNIKDTIVTGNRVYIHLISDILYLLGNILHSEHKLKSIKDIFRTYFGPKKFAVLSLDDPMPFVIDVIMSLRNKIKHPLFYLRELIKGE
ncbi:ATP-grasp domain-containing protein [Candidatus Woesearchaeota archaeon]|nr:ATP-grasp domain-containing protein [Candidatus Woesearchaeota archaeon]